MSQNVASSKSTGGGGYSFEDAVGAWWLLHLLHGTAPLTGRPGIVRRVRFQARVDEFRLDDHVLDCDDGRILVSARSAGQIRASTLPADFVNAAWHQVAVVGDARLDPCRDIAVLAQPELASSVRESVSRAVELAVADPESLHLRVRVPGWVNDDIRAVVESCAAPAGVAGQLLQEMAIPGYLLQGVRVEEFDFNAPSSRIEGFARAKARGLVASAQDTDAAILWDRLRVIARDGASTSASLDLARLHELLGAAVRLRSDTHFAPFWGWLSRTDHDFRAGVPSPRVGNTHLARSDDLGRLREAIAESRLCAAVGDSGSGKSCLVGSLLPDQLGADSVFTVRLDDLPDLFLSADRSSSSLTDILASAPGARLVLVVDGTEWAHAARFLKPLTRVVRAVSSPALGGRWRLILTCQTSAWNRVASALGPAVASSEWRVSAVSAVGPEELRQLRRENPAFEAILRRPEIARLASNLRLLAWIADSPEAAEEAAKVNTVGEAQLVDMLWSRAADQDLGAWLLVERIAARQAELRTRTLALADVSSSADAASVGALEARGILRRVRGTACEFTHDLFGDYGRQRWLLARVREGRVAEIEASMANPLWHRAGRLAAMHLLDIEPGAAPLDAWRALLEAARSLNPTAVTADLCLEALAFSASPSAALDAASSLLLDGDAALLRRFLTRFSLAASSPWPLDRAAATPLAIRIHSDAAFRLPLTALWPPVISWIHAHAQAVVQHAPTELVDLAETCLTPPAWGLVFAGESELADMVLTLADTEATDESKSWGNSEGRRRLFTVALRGARFQPARARELLRRLARRSTPASGHRRPRAPGSTPRGLPWEDRVPREPWPDGPVERPDDDFVHVVMGAVGADHLVRLEPGLAVETFLAALIAAPSGRGHHDPFEERELGLSRHRGAEPPFHDFPPASTLLRAAPLEGLEFVRRLVEFATSRWEDGALRGAPELGVPPAADSRAELPALVLLVGETDRRFSGDAGVLNWHRGGSNAPDGVAASLMALEQWLYELDPENLPISDLWDQLLVWRSAAIVGVLADVAVRTPRLLAGPLEPLVTCFELHLFSVQRAMVEGVDTAMIPWSLNHVDSRIKEVRDWHTLGHRGRRFDEVTVTMWARRNLQWQALHSAAERWRQLQVMPDGSAVGRLDVAETMAMFDRVNWKEAMFEGQPVWEYQPPVEIAARRKVISDEALRGFARIKIPDVAWRVIQGQGDASGIDVATLFAFAREPAPNGEYDARLRCAVAAMAIAALPRRLLALTAEPREARAWLLEAAAGVDAADRWRGAPDSFVMAFIPIRAPDPDWFAVVGIVEMWALDRSDVELRRAAARLAMAPAAETVSELFRRLAQKFGAGDRDVRCLARLVVEHAERRARELFREEGKPRALSGVRNAANKAAEVFAAGRPKALDAAWPEPKPRRQGHRWAYDEPYLVAAFSGLFKGASRPRQDDWLLAQLAALQGLVLGRLKPRPRNTPTWHDESTPYEWDNEVSALVASAVVEGDRAEKRRLLWGPWLQLTGEHHYWTEGFVEAAFGAAFQDPAPPEIAIAAVREIVEAGLAAVENASRLREAPFHDLGVLLGVARHSAAADRWSAARRPVANRLVDLWERWGRTCIPRHWDLDAFLRLAATPAAIDVRLRLMATLAGSLPEGKGLRDREEEALVRLLAVCWSECAGVLGPGPQRQAFDLLLRGLVSARNREAMALAELVTRGGT